LLLGRQKCDWKLELFGEVYQRQYCNQCLSMFTVLDPAQDNPRIIYDRASNRIARYLLGTRDKGFIVWLDMQQSFDFYVDADSCGNRDPVYSEDPNLAKSRMGYVIMYRGCPILWASKLQSTFALSTMESKYVARLAALQCIISVMDLLKEMQDCINNVESNLYIKCKLFVDNSGVLSQQKQLSMGQELNTSMVPGNTLGHMWRLT
jgi:hypothetical protein